MWETVARADDPFICCNFIPLDLEELQNKGFDFKTQQDIHDYIKKHILGKPNEELVLNIYKEIDFLGTVGPDALINSFTINCKDKATGKGQQNIELVNDLQNLVFNELTCKSYLEFFRSNTCDLSAFFRSPGDKFKVLLSKTSRED